MKLMSLICAVIPFLLPLHSATSGVFYIIALYYVGVILMAYIAVKEGDKCY